MIRLMCWMKRECIKKIKMEDKQVVSESDLSLIKEKIRSYPDFPKPGIVFRDIFSVLGDPEAAACLHKVIKLTVQEKLPDCDVIVGLDSRGFLFGSPLACALHKPFVPVRKKGKLPGAVEQVTYALEYGEDIFEIQSDSIKPGQKVLIIDDLLATGGTMEAACDLISSIGGEVSLSLVCIELVDLKGRDKLNVPFHSIVKY